MTRKITLKNLNDFFNETIVGEIFTYSQAFIPQDVIEIAEKKNITVEYCPPKTKEYLQHGCHTMKVISIGGKQITTSVRYRIADLDHPMYHPDTFDSPEEAREVLDKEYTNRNKGDGHDEYWRNRRTGIEKVTTTVELIFDNKTISHD